MKLKGEQNEKSYALECRFFVLERYLIMLVYDESSLKI